MRVGNWLVFFHSEESPHVLNCYVKAENAEQALEAAKAWSPTVEIHGVLSPELQDQLHLA